MDQAYTNAFILGYERLAAWSDLLDQINVFPVADADTGRNLKISLAPLRHLDDRPAEVPRRILMAATGNAGNIAAAFFHELLKLDGPRAAAAVIQEGVRLAYRAVVDPKPGTMLTVLDVLSQAVSAVDWPPSELDLETIIHPLEKCVDETTDMLPELREAGVVDAGSLGMFVFLEAFLGELTGSVKHVRPVTDRFGDKLRIADGWQPYSRQEQYCVSAVIRPELDLRNARRRLACWGNSLVVNEAANLLKVHVHTHDRRVLHSGLRQIGRVEDWTEEKIAPVQSTAPPATQPIHIMTDAAGSVTREDARTLGMTLLDSYLLVGDQSYPETLYSPASLYAAMAGGQKVSTAQASVFQRGQSFLSAVSRFERVLYLCVGSTYTGNFETAKAWQATNDAGGRLTVIDTGAASGRLGIVALATARHARQSQDPESVLRFARQAVAQSQEFVFLDQLKYLAAGGRISKTRGFFGDLLHMKPIITPSAHGAVKVGVAHTREGQLAFALAHLENCFDSGESPLILMQYSDNQAWVEQVAAVQLQSLLPAASILFRPLSLTSGAHMGPGAWAVAFLPSAFNLQETV